MNDLIQTIQILSEEEVSDLNKYVDSNYELDLTSVTWPTEPS
jgi:hypothetical protein